MNQIPRGIEVLVKKASVDPEFKQLLLTKREAAAEAIGLELTPAEALLLRTIPAEQLEKTIAASTVPEEHRRTFLGTCGLAMLAALGVITCVGELTSLGVRPGGNADRTFKSVADAIANDKKDGQPTPSKPPPKNEKITGSRPDHPDKK